MLPSNEEMNPRDYDVVVVGAGPAGCEAAVAAAAAGAKVLCLTINLDMVGYPPATPVLVENSTDRRYPLLNELKDLGGKLPQLLEKQDVATIDNVSGRMLVDRRLLGLAWKEMLEHTAGLTLRQALVTDLEPRDDLQTDMNRWLITTSLAEEFSAKAVIVAAGTFLNGRIVDAGMTTPGGRWAEIPSNSLANAIQQLGVELSDIWARTSPRISADGVGRSATEENILFRDGEQLNELYAYGLESEGDRLDQLMSLHENDNMEHAWITRASYTVLHQVLEAEQVGESLESVRLPGLFFAGRASGSCNYTEAAILGLIAGHGAAQQVAQPPIGEDSLIDLLLDRIAHRQIRPVTVRVDTESGC